MQIPQEVIKAITNNCVYQRPETAGLDSIRILQRFNSLLESRMEEELTDETLVEELDTLILDNPGTSVAQACAHYGILPGKRQRNADERLLFYILCHRFYNEDDDMVGWHDFEGYMDEERLGHLKARYFREKLTLQEDAIIEYSSVAGLVTKEYFRITDKVKSEIFRDAGGLKRRQTPIAGLIDARILPEKKLFFGPAERRQIDALGEIMEEKRFAQIQQSLLSKGHRTGFSCLFYGEPGTGKTETAYQLARASGRNVIAVDVTKLKDCLVGESEKNVKSLFDDYRDFVQETRPAPILLFNEADAILGVRKEGATSAVDKMENSIQNIILQEMENLNGILIATTNLTGNLDKAFERRFLYKVRFERPGREARREIWLSLLPELRDSDAERLAETFDLSGGQIENIARKYEVQQILSGHVPSLHDLQLLCQEESIDSRSMGRKIGF